MKHSAPLGLAAKAKAAKQRKLEAQKAETEQIKAVTGSPDPEVVPLFEKQDFEDLRELFDAMLVHVQNSERAYFPDNLPKDLEDGSLAEDDAEPSVKQMLPQIRGVLHECDRLQSSPFLPENKLLHDTVSISATLLFCYFVDNRAEDLLDGEEDLTKDFYLNEIRNWTTVEGGDPVLQTYFQACKVAGWTGSDPPLKCEEILAGYTKDVRPWLLLIALHYAGGEVRLTEHLRQFRKLVYGLILRCIEFEDELGMMKCFERYTTLVLADEPEGLGQEDLEQLIKLLEMTTTKDKSWLDLDLDHEVALMHAVVQEYYEERGEMELAAKWERSADRAIKKSSHEYSLSSSDADDKSESELSEGAVEQ